MVHSRIDGRYDIKDPPLGQGGMGIVYKAYDSQRKGYVALKTMKEVADPAALQLFAQEWSTLANISHPNIVDVLNSGEFDEGGERKPYFVMPLLPGKTLDKLIRDSGHRLTVERVVEILFQTCRGLQAAHAGGLIHRDLKPSNLFVMNDDSVKIIDFGMVHLADSKKSITGIKGTLQYMAPEQLDMKDVTPATDIFSLGVVAYEALTGRKPFHRPTEGATAQAIRTEFPPPASDINPAVNKMLAQVVAKAMAKGPWNRFGSAREFGDYLQKALKGDPIELFDKPRIQPRVERARRALAEGDFEYAGEILNELQLEGHVDSEITMLLQQVKQATRDKMIRQLLDSARTRLQEEEFPLAWQKVQEALQTDPGNREAQTLQAEIETRRSDQQMDKWRRLVHQHLHNQAFTQARQAIDEIRKIKPDDLEVVDLMARAGRLEKEFRRACEEKEQHFQSAMRSYGSGEISTALSKLEKILELDRRTPGFIAPGRDELYRETYNKIRQEWEAVQHAVAEIEKVIATGNLPRAAEISSEQSAKYPNDTGLQALKLKVEDLLRQEKSAYIAEVGRRVDAEPDLDRGVKHLEEALEKYPKEPHFEELASSLRKRRDLVNSIAAKARQYEEQNLAGEALGQWNTLRSIHPRYPGLDFDVERVQRRIEQHRREETKQNWVDRIDRLLQAGEHDRAHDLAVEALSAFPGDQELQSLKRLALEGRERSSEAVQLVERAQALCTSQNFASAIELLRRAADLDRNNGTVRTALANALAGHAEAVLSSDWLASEPLIHEALQIDPTHARAKSLRLEVLLKRRTEFVDRCVAEARELQAAGDIDGALAKVQEGLGSYPNDSRLVQLQKTLRNTLTEQANLRRSRDMEELRQISREVEQTRDRTSLTALLQRSAVLSELYPEDQEFSVMVSRIQQRANGLGGAKESPGPAPPIPALGARKNSVAWAQLAASVRMRVESFWFRLRSRAASVRLPDWKPFAGRFSWKQWAGAAAAVVAAIAVAGVVGSRPKDKPPAPLQVRVTLRANLDGVKIRVDGNEVSGGVAHLAPGPHSALAAKEGYKSAKRDFIVDANPATVELKLDPEPHVIRISADLPAAKVLLDDTQIGILDEGSFSYDLYGGGSHTLKVVEGKNEIFSVAFDAEPGSAIRAREAPSARELPVVVVSNLGVRAMVHSTVATMKVAMRDGEPQAIPKEGRELTLLPATGELTFDDGRKPMSLPVEIGNAPMLSIRAGSSNKGTLAIEANVDDAIVYVDGKKSARAVKRGKWASQLEPGEYKVLLRLSGYDDTAEQKVTVATGKSAQPLRFELRQAITVAYLRVQSGTPEADVLLDGRAIGKLDSAGSLPATPVAPDVEHSIRFHKENHEPSGEIKRRAPVKETIVISPPESKLKPFGTLVFEIQPPEAQVTFHRQGEAPRRVGEKTLSVREGAYAVDGSADGYENFQGKAQAVSGQSQTVRVALTRKVEKAVVIQAPKRVEVNELFTDASNWKRQDEGFWVHDGGTAWLNDLYFSRIFEVLKFKKAFGRQEKISWRIYLEGDDYLRCELDGSNYTRELYSGGKPKGSPAKGRVDSPKDFYRVEIIVERERVTQKIGQFTDTLACKPQRQTGFDGKIGLRLIK